MMKTIELHVIGELRMEVRQHAKLYFINRTYLFIILCMQFYWPWKMHKFTADKIR